MKNLLSLERLQEFSRLITAFGKVERIYCIPGTDRKENDLEHSYMLAMLGWYIAESNALPFSQEKILKYALAHDLVEVYAGDTYIYSKDKAHLDSKMDREGEAAERLKMEFPEIPEMHEFLLGYMKREDPESKFVYALDKILPILLIQADGGRSWKEHGVTLDMLIQNKTNKVAVSPDIEPYFNELVTLLTSQEKELFGSSETDTL